MINYTTVQNHEDLTQILLLQQKNREQDVSKNEAIEQGFVTVSHEFETLEAMNHPFPHIIAKDAGRVVGYTLVMQKAFEKKIPVLVPMFEKINAITYAGELLKDVPYFVMGQVCIDKANRGKGIFKGLYQKMKEEMSPHFKYIITEVAIRNTRSMRAHEKVGFETIKEYQADGEDWAIILWNWGTFDK